MEKTNKMSKSERFHELKRISECEILLYHENNISEYADMENDVVERQECYGYHLLCLKSSKWIVHADNVFYPTRDKNGNAIVGRYFCAFDSEKDARLFIEDYFCDKSFNYSITETMDELKQNKSMIAAYMLKKMIALVE